MEYKYFYAAARRYAKEKISRAMFIMDWAEAQRKSGVKVAAWKK
jgi:hypothetical protein